MLGAGLLIFIGLWAAVGFVLWRWLIPLDCTPGRPCFWSR